VVGRQPGPEFSAWSSAAVQRDVDFQRVGLFARVTALVADVLSLVWGKKIVFNNNIRHIGRTDRYIHNNNGLQITINYRKVYVVNNCINRHYCIIIMHILCPL